MAARPLITLRLPPGTDIHAEVTERLDAEARGLALEFPFYRSQQETLLETVAADDLHSVGLFLPLPRLAERATGCPFSLVSPDGEDKRQAAKHAMETLRFAADFRIRTIRIPSARLDLAPRSSWRPAAAPPPVASPQEESEPASIASQVWRPEEQAHLSAYLGHLSRLLEFAAEHELTLALGLSAGGFPSVPQLAYCFEEFAGAPLALWPKLPGLTKCDAFCARLAEGALPHPPVATVGPDHLEAAATDAPWTGLRELPATVFDGPARLLPYAAERLAEPPEPSVGLFP